MKIALFVEGLSDKETLSILVKKILGEQFGVITKVFRGKGNLLNEREVYTRIIYTTQEHLDLSKILVCVDSECTPEDQTERELKKVEDSIKTKTQLPIYYVGVIHALEGWLLADPDAVRKYLDPRVQINISSSATSHCRPKEVLKGIFKRVEKEFLPTRDCLEIAKEVDISKLAKHNESFRLFRKRVKDP